MFKEDGYANACYSIRRISRSKNEQLDFLNLLQTYNVVSNEQDRSVNNPQNYNLFINNSMDALISASTALSREISKREIKANYIVAADYNSLFLSAFVGERARIPFLMLRKEAKSYGTKKLIEGSFKNGDKVLLIQDVVNNGASLLNAAKVLRQLGLICEDVFCILDCISGSSESTKGNNLTLHSLLISSDIAAFVTTTDDKFNEQYKLMDVRNTSVFYTAVNTVSKNTLLAEYEALGIFKFGQFTLKSGLLSPVYIDFRETGYGLLNLVARIINNNSVQIATANAMTEKIRDLKINVDYITGVPYGAMLLTALVGERINVPIFGVSKEVQVGGSRELINSTVKKGKRALIIEDVVTSGGSILEIVDYLRGLGFICDDAICLLDRRQGGRENLLRSSVQLHWLYTLNDALDFMISINKLDVMEKINILKQLKC